MGLSRACTRVKRFSLRIPTAAAASLLSLSLSENTVTTFTTIAIRLSATRSGQIFVRGAIGRSSVS